MSYAPNAALALGAAVESPFDLFLAGLNGNPYFIGMMMLILNLGGRFVGQEMTKGQEDFFQNPWIRRVLIYVIIFIGTRNILVAFILGTIIILCVGYLFNEQSSLFIWRIGIPGATIPQEQFQNKEAEPEPNQMGQATPVFAPSVNALTPEESEILHTLQQKAAGLQTTQSPYPVQVQPLPVKYASPSPSILTRYFNNMRILQNK